MLWCFFGVLFSGRFREDYRSSLLGLRLDHFAIAKKRHLRLHRDVSPTFWRTQAWMPRHPNVFIFPWTVLTRRLLAPNVANAANSSAPIHARCGPSFTKKWP